MTRSFVDDADPGSRLLPGRASAAWLGNDPQSDASLRSANHKCIRGRVSC